MEDIYVRSINETLDEVKANLRIQLKGKPMYIPTWIGKPGIAKTTHAKMIAKELNLKFYYVSMSKPVEFFSGLPITSTLTIDQLKENELYTVWSCPDLIYHANKYSENEKYDGVLLFLDDLHVASQAVQNMFFELVLERSLNSYKLNKNVVILAAMNDSIESGYEGFFGAITNRLQFIHVKMDFNYWYEQLAFNLNPFIATFLRQNSEFREETENTREPFATYRSWTMLSNILDKFDSTKDDFANICFNIALGFVSVKAANAFKASVVLQKEFNFEGVLKGEPYNLPKDDIIKQIIFSNIIRFIKKEKDIQVIEGILDNLGKDAEGYRNAIMAIIMEIKSYRHFLGKKISSGKKNIVEKYVDLYKILNKLITSVIQKDYIKRLGTFNLV